MTGISRRAESIRPFVVMDVVARAKELEAQGRDIVRLEIGDPDFPTPEVVVRAAESAMDAGDTGYTQSLGLPDLRDAISAHMADAYGVAQDPGDIIVTQGQYDHIEEAFSLGQITCTRVDPRQIDEANLRPDQVIFVNCPGHFSPQGLRKLHQFVEEGGFLFTTDWALKHVLEPAFPGFVEYNGRSTADEVVRVEILDRADPFLSSILGPNDEPQW